MTRILVIKLGALGDFIAALGPMKAIRAHHPDARITLLTTKPFEQLGRDCGYFDEVWVDSKPKWHQPLAWAALRSRLNGARFDRVYDLQNNDRTALYFRLFSPRPEWVGAAPGASHRNASPERTAGRAFDGHVQTLALAGVSEVEPDRLDWMKGDTGRFALRRPYVLLIPGSSPQRPRKRFPVASYRACARALLEQGFQIVVLGGPAEAADNAELAQGLDVLDLTGQTSLYDLAALARDASGALGNDTGPSHIVAVTGCPTLVLYCTRESNARRHGPLGSAAQTFEADDLAALSPDAVLEKFLPLVRRDQA